VNAPVQCEEKGLGVNGVCEWKERLDVVRWSEPHAQGLVATPDE